jgi:hypothetical protein
MARGVHGRIDLTVPGGGSSDNAGGVADCCVTAESKEEGSINRMLHIMRL